MGRAKLKPSEVNNLYPFKQLATLCLAVPSCHIKSLSCTFNKSKSEMINSACNTTLFFFSLAFFFVLSKTAQHMVVHLDWATKKVYLTMSFTIRLAIVLFRGNLSSHQQKTEQQQQQSFSLRPESEAPNRIRREGKTKIGQWMIFLKLYIFV